MFTDSRPQSSTAHASRRVTADSPSHRWRRPRAMLTLTVPGLLVTLLLAGASTAGAQCAAPACPAATCFVNDGTGTDGPGCCTAGGCKTIKGGIDDAVAGDVIEVAAGTYPEVGGGPLNINKTVTLCGANDGVDARGIRGPESIIADSQGTIASASNVVVNGFTIQGNTDTIFPYGLDMAQGTTGTQVLNNIVQNNIAGIGLANKGPDQVLICQNLIQNNNNPGSATGSGIYTDQYVCGITGGFACTDFLIEQNAFKGNDTAAVNISVEDSDPSGCGGPCSPLTKLDMSTNSVDGGRAALLFNVDQSTIHNNTITNANFSTPGSGAIRIFGSVDDLTITNNDLNTGNGWAIRITGGPSSGVVIHQNDIANFLGAGGPFGGGLFVAAGSHTGAVDAGCNWWDDPCGPFNVAANPNGIGEEVEEAGVPGDADFTPWLTSPGPAPASGSGTCSGTVCTELNHFQCYEIRKVAAAAGPVTVQDQFGSSTGVSLSKPNRLCAPTNKRNEDPTAPTDPTI
jgi:hypothetical protein